jgi:hypothetical protein
MTHSNLDELARIAAIDFSRRLVSRWQRVLGTELLGAYLIGSLAHAGFNRRYSDIDIALVTTADCPCRCSIVCEAKPSRFLPIGDQRFQFSGPTSASLSADFHHSIASIILITRLR